MGVKYEDLKDSLSRSKMSSIDFSKVFMLISNMIKPFYGYISVLTATAIAQTVLICFRELSIKFIIDKLVSFDGISMALVWVGCLMVGDIAVELSYRITDRMNYKYRPKLKQHIAKTLLKKMMSYTYSFYQNKNSTELATCITNVFDGVENSIMIIFDEFIHFSLLVFITSIYATIVSVKIAMILMLWGILWLVAAIYWGGNMYFLTYSYSKAEVELEGNMADLFNHMFVVQSFHNVDHEMDNVTVWTDKLVNAETVLRKMQFKVWLIQGFVFCLVNSSILVYVVYLYSWKMVTAGDVSFVFGLIANLYSALWDLAKEVREFIDASGKIAQGMHILREDEVKKGVSYTDKLEVKKGEIIFDQIEFAYPSRQFHDDEDKGLLFTGEDNVRIKPGEFIGLVGPSGSGKSTLMKLLLRIFDITGGKIYIDGQDISQVSLESLRDQIAFIPQDSGLFMRRTIAENIGYGTFEEINEESMYKIIQAAKKTQSHEFIMRLPEQYNTVLGEYGINLSGGQKQRLAITRGFVRNASIFLLDEATSALDNLTQSSVQEYIRESVAKKTCLVIAHRLYTLQDADRVLVFDKGRVVQSGKHEELIEQEGLYRNMWYS